MIKGKILFNPNDPPTKEMVSLFEKMGKKLGFKVSYTASKKCRVGQKLISNNILGMTE